MRKYLWVISALCFLFPVTLSAQRDSLRNDFLDAESWFLFEEFSEALPLYMKIHSADPENANINYKIGICLLNDPYQKEKSIRYLLDASEHINPDYKENSYKERTAPPDVLYYLGKAYMVNQDLDRAVESFERFLEILDPGEYDRELVNEQIRACRNARLMMRIPVDIDLRLLDSLINTRYADTRPVVSGDGEKMVFVTELPFYDGIFFTEMAGGEWSYPRNITAELGFDADVYPACLSSDGTEMILYFDDDYIGSLYHSEFADGRWLPAEKLGENINTKFWESHACFSSDGQTLYFTSNRKGSIGGLDIYRSDRQGDGSWGIPENLGPVVNTRHNEMSPFITEDGQTLYFSSYGHDGMGGYDIFYSRRNEDGSWGVPVNLGYPLNTTDDDLFYHPVDNGKAAYYSIYDEERGIGRHDIYYVDVYSPENPRMYQVTGHLYTAKDAEEPVRGAIGDTVGDAGLAAAGDTVGNGGLAAAGDTVGNGGLTAAGDTVGNGGLAAAGDTLPALAVVHVVNPATGDTLLSTSPDRATGAFSFSLPQGIYRMHFSAPGHDPVVMPLDITAYTDKSGVTLPGEIRLEPEVKEPLVFEGEAGSIRLTDSLYTGQAGETLSIPLQLLQGSTLITRIWQDSVLVSTDTLEADSVWMALELEPLPGTSRVELAMTDTEGNIHLNKFILQGTEPVMAHEPSLAETVQEPPQAEPVAVEGAEEEIIASAEDGAAATDEVAADAQEEVPAEDAEEAAGETDPGKRKDRMAEQADEGVRTTGRWIWPVTAGIVAVAALLLLLIVWRRRRRD